MAIKSLQYKQMTLDISYEILNPQASVDLIVLHGWGSNKNLMKGAFAPFMQGFRHIYIDLPGFGKSTCSQAMTTEDVARIVEMFMVLINASKDIILGHSFGGKVALLLEPKLLVLVASAGIYIPKPLKVRAKIAIFKCFKSLGLVRFRSLFVAQDAQHLSEPMYETFKNVVDEDYAQRFQRYTRKAVLFWGKEDTATPLFAGEKMHTLLEDSQMYAYEGDHYFFLKASQNIATQVEETFLQTLGE